MLSASQARRVKKVNKGWVSNDYAIQVAEDIGLEKVIEILIRQPELPDRKVKRGSRWRLR